MTDWLHNPLSLFDVRGKVAIVTGASGAFGALAAKVLAGAGAKLFISTGNEGELAKVAAGRPKFLASSRGGAWPSQSVMLKVPNSEK